MSDAPASVLLCPGRHLSSRRPAEIMMALLQLPPFQSFMFPRHLPPGAAAAAGADDDAASIIVAPAAADDDEVTTAVDPAVDDGTAAFAAVLTPD